MNVSKPAAQVVFDMIEEFIDATESLAHQLERLTPSRHFPKHPGAELHPSGGKNLAGRDGQRRWTGRDRR